MSKETQEQGFEQKLLALEALVKQMEEGGLKLDEMLKLYEQGSLLAQGLRQDLDAAQAKLQKLKSGKLQDMDENSDV